MTQFDKVTFVLTAFIVTSLFSSLTWAQTPPKSSSEVSAPEPTGSATRVSETTIAETVEIFLPETVSESLPKTEPIANTDSIVEWGDGELMATDTQVLNAPIADETAIIDPTPTDIIAMEAEATETESVEIVSIEAMPVEADAPETEISEPLSKPVPGFEGCEIVLFEPVAKDAGMASYRPADAFIETLYDDLEGYADTVDGLKVRAVMCTRDNIIPKLRDFPVVATGLQFSVSNDFDRYDSQLITVYYQGGQFKYKYSGPELSAGDQIALTDVMEIYNLQDHDLE